MNRARSSSAGDPRNTPSPARRRVRLIIVSAALLLPTLSLIPLGGLFLWQNGLLLWWAILAFVMITVVYLLQRWMLGDTAARTDMPGIDPPPDVIWSPAEEAAWTDVKHIAAKVDVDKLDSPEALADLAHRTVNAVARRLHPEKADALWHFTIPEALMIAETVSVRLRSYVIGNIPFGDRLTVSQFLTAYRWRHVADLAERAYDIWRLVRLANPATAVTHEARERLSKAMLQWGREHVIRGLAETFVEETGRAAIDLYGGRLKLRTAIVRAEPAAEQPAPLVALIAGGSLVERAEIAATVQAYEIELSSRPRLLLRTSEAEPQGPKAAEKLAAELRGADLVLLAVPASDADADTIERALAAAGDLFRADPQLCAPPVIAIDSAGSPREGTALAEAVLKGLLKGYPGPLLQRIELTQPPPDADFGPQSPLARALLRAEPLARKTHILRQIDARKRASDWVVSGRQAVSAVGSFARAVVSKLPLKPRWK